MRSRGERVAEYGAWQPALSHACARQPLMDAPRCLLVTASSALPPPEIIPSSAARMTVRRPAHTPYCDSFHDTSPHVWTDLKRDAQCHICLSVYCSDPMIARSPNQSTQ